MLQFCHEPAEPGSTVEPRIAGQQRDRRFAGLDDRVLVAEHAQRLQRAAETRLRAAENVTLATLVEVDPAQLEAVGGAGDRVEALARRGSGLRVSDQQAQPRQAATTDAAAQ